jgi:preprotein translocase subunit SecA
MRETICEMIADEIADLVENVSARKKIPDQNVENLCRELESVFDIKEAETAKYISDKKETIRVLTDIMLDRYESIENMLPTKNMLREIERQVLLKAIDRHWMEHIDQMDRLRQSIRLQSFGQKDPKIEYRKIGYEMFEDMSFAIIRDTLSMLFRIQISWS